MCWKSALVIVVLAVAQAGMAWGDELTQIVQQDLASLVRLSALHSPAASALVDSHHQVCGVRLRRHSVRFSRAVWRRVQGEDLQDNSPGRSQVGPHGCCLC